MTTLYLDIETLPADWTDAQKDAHAAVSVPGNYTKPDSIARWIAENRDEAHARTALDWRYCRVLAIGYAIDDGPPSVLYSHAGADVGLVRMLDALVRVIDAALERVTLVGHSIIGFDLPILTRNAWRLGHPLADLLQHHVHVSDTGEIWKCGDRRALNVRLADIARFLGVGEKTEGMSGKDVFPAWQRQEHEKIITYCAQDVELTRAIYQRIK